MPVTSEDSRSDWPKYAALVLRELERLEQCDREHTAYHKELEKSNKEYRVANDKRIDKLERLAWLLTGFFALHTPVYIYLIIELVKHLLNL